MTTKLKNTLPLAIIIALFAVSSCVPARKYEELVERRDICESQNRELKQENEKLFTMGNELRSQRDQLLQQVENLRRDTTEVGIQQRRLRENYDRLAKTYEIVLEHNEKLLEGKEMETTHILRELQETQEDLQRREDELRKATSLMQEKEDNLNALAQELAIKEQRVNQLEEYITRQDSIVTALRNSVASALLGFEGQGLSIEIREGRVYVSMEESLLFATGSTQVGSRGVNALRQLAGALENNPEINILIEGHTDDVPFRPGSQIRDNWDLSVLRATAIVRILLENSKIEPRRLTAAGRGEFMPLDPAKTPEARSKNRRTEIILTPRLGDLFQIIEMN